MGKVTPAQHPRGIPGTSPPLELGFQGGFAVPFPLGQLQSSPKRPDWGHHTDPTSLPTPKTALGLPPRQEMFYKAFFPLKTANLSPVQRWEAPGRDPGGAVSVPHTSQLWGRGGAARAPRQGHPPRPGAGIIIPTVWEWLQGHETAWAGLELAPTRPLRAQHGLCVLQPRWPGVVGGKGATPSPQEGIQGLDDPSTSRDQPLKHHNITAPNPLCSELRKLRVPSYGFGVLGTS